MNARVDGWSQPKTNKLELCFLQSSPLTTAFCSRLALPREITLFFLDPRAKVSLSPGNRPAGSGDKSRCPLGVSVQIFGSVEKSEWRGEKGRKSGRMW